MMSEVDKLGTGVAFASATNKLWIWTIQDISDFASLALTVLGIIYLLMQMVRFMRTKK